MRIIETRRAPNPRRVGIFLAEKGLEVAREERDVMAGDLKCDDFAALNPWQRVPILVLDDGRVIAESVAICRYFEEVCPEPPLLAPAASARPKSRCGTGAWNSAFSARLPAFLGTCIPNGASRGTASRGVGTNQ